MNRGPNFERRFNMRFGSIEHQYQLGHTEIVPPMARTFSKAAVTDWLITLNGKKLITQLRKSSLAEWLIWPIDINHYPSLKSFLIKNVAKFLPCKAMPPSSWKFAVDFKVSSYAISMALFLKFDVTSLSDSWSATNFADIATSEKFLLLLNMSRYGLIS